MSVIKDSKHQPAAEPQTPAGWRLPQHVVIFNTARMTILLTLLVLWLVFTGGPAAAVDKMPSKSIAQIRLDDDGRTLTYPVDVFFDPVMEEIYLVNGISARVVVYGPDFFPRVSIGASRGIIAPRGVTVLENGEVYICQTRNYKNPAHRITVLNGAFFVDREIFFDQIEGAAKLRPRQVAISSDGSIYLAGDDHRGVLVLDNDGNFLRWLKPLDQVSPAAYSEQDEEIHQEQEELAVAEAEEGVLDDDILANIPEEFRPGSSAQDDTGETQKVLGPVKINFVTIDKTGKLYALSAETGKIYVYNADESFLFSFGTKGGSPGQLSQPRSLTINEEQGLVYVIDYMRHTILSYNMAGEFLFEVGGRGLSPGWFNFPTDLAINSQGQLIVADLMNSRVQVLEVDREAVATYLETTAEQFLLQSPDSEDQAGQDEDADTQPGTATEQDEDHDQPEVPDPMIEDVGLPEDVDESAEDFDVQIQPLTAPDEDAGDQPEAATEKDESHDLPEVPDAIIEDVGLPKDVEESAEDFDVQIQPLTAPDEDADTQPGTATEQDEGHDQPEVPAAEIEDAEPSENSGQEDEFSAGQPESLDNQGNKPDIPSETPGEVTEEKIIVEETIEEER